MPDALTSRQLPALILLVDDDAISREVLQMTLEAHGFEVETAEDGATALTRLADGPSPEVILMDTQMPGLSGPALIAALRTCSRARIVAISGSDPGAEVRNATEGFLLKPIQPEDLAALLNSTETSTTEPDSAKPDQTEPALSELGTAAKTHAAEQTDLVDPVVLGKLKAMMPASSVREIYVAVAADLHTRLAALQEAMDTGNGAEVSRIAHAIKGGCAMVGLSSAREAAARLETSNAPVTWPSELVQLHSAMNGLEGMLGDDFPA